MTMTVPDVAMDGIDDEQVFVALSDSTRRSLLDDLYRCDGQRPAQLSARYDISRQAVLRHLTVLEAAGLITAERVRSRTVYRLNRETLKRVHSAWFAKFMAYPSAF